MQFVIDYPGKETPWETVNPSALENLTNRVYKQLSGMI